MARPAAEGAEIQETSTAAPAQTAQEHTINTTTSVEQSRERGTSEMGRTPLRRLQDTLRRRFGSEILRNSSSRPGTTAGSGSDQRREEAVVILLQDSALVQRRAGKAPMTAQQQAQKEGRFCATATGDTRIRTTPAIRCGRPSNMTPRREGGEPV